MLRALRHKGTQKKIYIFLAVVVTLSFGVSGVLISRDDKNTSGALAIIGKHKITIQEYLDSYRAVERQASFIYGNKLNEVKSRINFKSEAWDRLLLLDYARNQNIRATDAEVVEWLSAQPSFQSKDKFDEKLYELYVERGLRSTPRAFEEEMRQTLTIDKVQDVIKSKPSWTDAKLKEIYQKEKSEKDILVAALPWETQKEKVTITDKDIEMIYSIVKDKLSTPERVKVSYLFIPKEKNEELKGALQDKTQTIDQLSKSFGIVVKETGFISKDEAATEFKNAPEALLECFKTASGEESSWVETSQGNYKIKILDKQAERAMSLEESREELKKIYTRQSAVDLAFKKLTSLKEKMKSSDFESVLKVEGLEIKPFTKYHPGADLAGIYLPENAQKALSSLKEGEISDGIETSQGAMIAKVTKVYPLDEKKFEQDKEAFKKERSKQQFIDDMSELLEKLRKNLSLNLERMKEIFPSEEPTK